MGSLVDGHELPLYAMKGGDGSLSYVKNSTYQSGVLYVAKPILEEEIAAKLQISSSQNAFCIADFGWLNWHQLLSGHADNKVYNVAAVPGGFHRRLLPSEVPKAVADGDSPAWNGGEILYTRGGKEVCDAYLDRFGRDIESFFKWRAVEIVDGGFTPRGSGKRKKNTHGQKGPKIAQHHILNNTGKLSFPNIRARVASFRAVHESMLAHHFGVEINDELFDLYDEKLAASPVFSNAENDKTIMILAVLKRRID